MRSVKYLFMIMGFVFCIFASGQSVLNLRGGIDFCGLGGMAGGYKFAQKGKVLKRDGAGYYSDEVAFHLKLQYRVSKNYALNFQCQLTEYDLGVRDDNFISRNKIDYKQVESDAGGARNNMNGFLGAFKYYTAPSLSIQRFFSFGFKHPDKTCYFAFGAQYNFRNGKEKYTCTTDYSANMEMLTLNTRFLSKFQSYYLEFGYNYDSEDDGLVFSMGLRWTIGPSMMNADYLDVQNSKTINTDWVRASSSYLAFHFGVGGILTYHRRKNEEPIESVPVIVDSKVHKEIGDDTITHVDSAADKNSKRDKPAYSRTEIDTINRILEGRSIIAAGKAVVPENEVLITVWDNSRVDGDVVSLNLNGDWVLENKELTSAKFSFMVSLKPGSNFLVLHAINEGLKKPCTLAISIGKGNSEQNFIINSSMRNSEFIRIICTAKSRE